MEGGTFLPNLPLLRHIRAEVQQNENIIDFANGELGCNLYPHDQLQTILREQPLTLLKIIIIPRNSKILKKLKS